MGIVFRQSVKSTIVIFLGNILGALFTFFGAYAFKDDLQALGFSRTIFSIGIIGQVVVSFGAGTVLQLFLQRYPPQDIRKKVLITLCTMTPVVVAILLLPLYLLLKDDLVFLFKPADRGYFMQYYLWIAVLIVTWAYTTLYEYYLMSQHKTAQALFVREVILRAGNLVVLAFYYFDLISFHVFIVGSVLLYCLPVLILVLLALRTEGFGYATAWKAFSRKEYKEIFQFAWSHLLAGISFSLIGYLDALMLASLNKDGLASVPVYQVAVFIVSIMTIPYRAMAAAVMPPLNQAYIDKDHNRLQDTFSRSSLNLLVVTTFMLLVIGLNLGNAVAIFPKGFEDVALLSLVMMLGRMVDMGTGLNGEVISISSYYRFNFRISILLLVLVVGLDLLLIPKYGTFGAAWGVTIAQVIYNIAKLVFVRKKMDLNPYTMKTLTVLFMGAIVALVVYFIPGIVNPVIDAVVRSAIIAILYLGLLMWLRPSADISTYITSVIQKKRLF